MSWKDDIFEIRYKLNEVSIDAHGHFEALLILCNKLDELNDSLKAVLERLPEKPERQPPQQ